MSMKRHRSISASSSGSDFIGMDSQQGRRPRYRESNKVYVSNVYFKCTTQQLIDEFSAAGEVTYVEMIRDDNNHFKGCAVITFTDAKMANKAIETLNRQEFQGRKLVVKEGEANPESNVRHQMQMKKPHNERNMMKPSIPSLLDQNTFGLSAAFLSSLKIDLPLVTTVFVANLGYDITEKMLKEVFNLAGNVISCEIFTGKDGNSKGFGIVDYEHPVEAVQAISMLNNQVYNDRLLSVRMDRSEKRRDNKVRLPSGLKSVGMGLGVDGNPLRDMKSFTAARTPVQTLPGVSPLDSIGGGLMVASPLNSFGTNLADTVGSSLTLGQSLRGIPDIAPRRLSDLSPLRRMPDISRGMTDVTPRNMSVISPRGLDSSASSATLGNIVRLTNLPLDYTSDNLQKLLWNCGDVIVAEMRSKGTGIVRLRTDRDAQRAVQMLDRQPMAGQLLSAQLL